MVGNLAVPDPNYVDTFEINELAGIGAWFLRSFPIKGDLCDPNANSVLIGDNLSAEAIGPHLRKLSTEKQDLRRIINPQQQANK